MADELVRRGVEVLEDHRVEAPEVLGEELVDGEADQRELALLVGHAGVAPIGAEDEERDDVDRRVALQPHPQRADIVGRPPRDVEHADALARDVEGEEAAIVFRDLVARRRLDRDLDQARARAIEGHREAEGRRSVLELREPRREERGRRAVEELADADRDRLAREPVAADLHRERERLVRDRGAGGLHRADARVARRTPRDRYGVDGDTAPFEETGHRRGEPVRARRVEPSSADDDDRARLLVCPCDHLAERGRQVGVERERRRGGGLLERLDRPFAEPEGDEARVLSRRTKSRERARCGSVARPVVPGEEHRARAIDEDDYLRADLRSAGVHPHRSEHGDERERGGDEAGEADGEEPFPSAATELYAEENEAEERDEDGDRDRRAREIGGEAERPRHGGCAARRRIRNGAWT